MYYKNRIIGVIQIGVSCILSFDLYRDYMCYGEYSNDILYYMCTLLPGFVAHNWILLCTVLFMPHFTAFVTGIINIAYIHRKRYETPLWLLQLIISGAGTAISMFYIITSISSYYNASVLPPNICICACNILLVLYLIFGNRKTGRHVQQK